MPLVNGITEDLTSSQVLHQLRLGDPYLANLQIHMHQIDENEVEGITSNEELNEVGQEIGRSVMLEELRIVAEDVENEGQITRALEELELICEGIELGEHTRIRTLHLYDFGKLGGKTIQSLTRFIQNNTALDTIYWEGFGMTGNQLELLGSALATRTSVLEALNMNDSGMGDNELEIFISSFTDFPDRLPKYFQLKRNNIGLAGCQQISKFLSSPNCSLKALCLDGNIQINDHVTAILARGLATNTSLEWMGLKSTSITTIGWNEFDSIVCNNTTVQCTYKSNHTLHHLGHFGNHDNPLPTGLQELLEMNQQPDKKLVACRKVLANHFSWSSRMNVFQEMNPSVLIHVPLFFDKAFAVGAVQVRERDTLYLSYFYKMMQNNPLLCQSGATAGRKG